MGTIGIHLIASTFELNLPLFWHVEIYLDKCEWHRETILSCDVLFDNHGTSMGFYSGEKTNLRNPHGNWPQVMTCSPLQTRQPDNLRESSLPPCGHSLLPKARDIFLKPGDTPKVTSKPLCTPDASGSSMALPFLQKYRTWAHYAYKFEVDNGKTLAECALFLLVLGFKSSILNSC